MGLMDKFKTLFTVEVDDEPIKKEVIKVQIDTPVEEKKEVVKETKEVVEEVKPVIKEEKPVFFDDLEFDTMTRASMPKKDLYQKKEVQKDVAPKKFSPSPVISPVYGVLDKNYSKEDIKPLKSGSSNFEFTKTGEITIDDIRKKAYGTLEDELEINLLKENVKEEPKKDELDMFDELEDMDSLEELNNLDHKEAELLKDVKQDKIEEKKDDDETLDLNKDDLFDLIDSMYEKRGDE